MDRAHKRTHATTAAIWLAAAILVSGVASRVQTTDARGDADRDSPSGWDRDGAAVTAAGLDFVGQIGGASLAVEVDSEVVYLGAGPTVRAFDPDPLTRPGAITSSPVLDDAVRGLASHPGGLLAAAGRHGLVVLNPAEGLAVTRALTWTIPSHGVAVAGERAYVAVPGTGVMIVDPRAASPVLGTAAISTVVGPIDAGDDGWVAAITSNGAAMIDARDPVSTSFGAAFEPGARALDIDGDRLLVAGPAGVRIYQLVGDAAPRLAGGWSGGPATAVLGVSGRAFVALADGSGAVLSLADPANPIEDSTFRLAGWAAALRFSGGRLMAAVNRGSVGAADPYDLGGGLEVLDDGGPSLARRSLLEMPSGGLTDVDLDGGEAWAVEADLGGGFEGRAWSFDLAEPARPLPMGSVMLEGTPQRVAALPPYGFFTTTSGLHVTRTTPDRLLRPVKVQPGVLPGPADLFAWGYHLWAVGGTDLFEVLDASYPLDVRSVDLTANPDLMAATSVAVTDGRAYAAGENGLAVVDVRERSHPRTLARLTNVGPASGVAVWDHVALVANRTDGLRLVDARSISEIAEMSHLEGPGLAGVAAHGPAAYLLTLEGGLTLADVSDPEAPATVASAGLPAFAADAAPEFSAARVDADAELAVVAHPHRGLMVYSASDAPGPTPTPVRDPAPVFLPALYRSGAASPPRYSLARRGTYMPLNTRPFGFQVVDSIAYVGMEGGESDWLATVDLANPALPIHIGRSDDLGGTPLRVAATRSVAYVATGDAGLKVVDTTNPVLPIVVGSFDTQAELINLALSPDYRRVVGLESLAGSGSTQVVVYDVSDPSRPSELGRTAITEGAAATGVVWPTGGQAVVTIPQGVLRLDLSDPQRPRVASSRMLSGAAEPAARRGVRAASSSLVGVVNRGSETVPGGLWLLDGSADGLPESGALVSIDWPDVQGARQASWYDHVLLAASEDDLTVFDTTNPYWPRMTFELVDDFQDLHEVQLESRFAYVTDPIDGFVVLDVIPDR